MKKYLLFLFIPLLGACNSSQEITTTQVEEPVARVVEYMPAPGQFINEPKSGFGNVTTMTAACAYAQTRMAEGNYVSLGGWGGYIVAAFAQPVPNTGDYELYVMGNQFPDSSEPGVVWVAEDADGNGEPDAWFQLRGSEYATSVRDYHIVYHRPTGDNQSIVWEDNQPVEEGGVNKSSGTIDRMPDHTQASYYPAWTEGGKLEFDGVRLPDNLREGEVDDNGNPVQGWIAQPFAWGYADNYSTTARKGMTGYFRISDAVTATGQPANIRQISFIKIQTGVNAKAPRIGEISTEVRGIGCIRTVTGN